MTRVLVVRHGESTWNADGRWQGHADPPLSEVGERQARLAGAALSRGFEVFTSDLQRARRTAELLAETAGLAPVRLEPLLRERDIGEWSGRTHAEIEEQWPGYLAARRTPPGWEGDPAVVARARTAIAAILEVAPAWPVLAVTHGGWIRTLERALGVDPEPVPNLGGRWLDVVGGHLHAGPRATLIDPDDAALATPR